MARDNGGRSRQIESNAWKSCPGTVPSVGRRALRRRCRSRRIWRRRDCSLRTNKGSTAPNAATKPRVGVGLATDGLTGSEIEQAFIDALYAAFAEGREPSILTVSLVLNDLVPLSRLMGEQIQALRQWAKGRARLATTRVTASAGRKLAA